MVMVGETVEIELFRSFSIAHFVDPAHKTPKVHRCQTHTESYCFGKGFVMNGR